MILKKADLAEFARHVKRTEKPIVVYGAGVIGRVAAPYWLRKYGLDRAVRCYVDADVHKRGQVVPLGIRNVPIRSLSALNEERDYVLLITVSAFEPVVRSLDQLPGTENAETYFLPIMLLDAVRAGSGSGVVRIGATPLIPKKIHYCWFSGNPVPESLQKCMDSWREYCPDYEIIRWDESNYDIHKCPYMEQAYASRKWGFVPDFARLDILYQYGGIYLDTDVELVRGLDDLLYQPAFCSMENWGTVNIGGCAGAQAGNLVFKNILDFRRNASFLRADGSFDTTSCGYYETTPLISMGLRPDGTTQMIADGKMTVYAPDYFHPFDYMSGEVHITGNTFSIHHFSGTWLGDKGAQERERTRARYQEFVRELEELP